MKFLAYPQERTASTDIPDFLVGTDIAALTREAADVSGIQYIMDVDGKEADKILAGCPENCCRPVMPQKL